MSFFKNLLSSPAKPSPARKHGTPDPSSLRSGEKRKREPYDPSAYQNAVYAGASAVSVTDDEPHKPDTPEMDDDGRAEAVAYQLRNEAEAEAERNEHRRLKVTPKSVRRRFRERNTAIETRAPDDKAISLSPVVHLIKPTNRQTPGAKTNPDGGGTTEEDDTEGDSGWSDEDLHISFSPTCSGKEVVTSTNEVLVEQLKNVPVGKRLKARTGSTKSSPVKSFTTKRTTVYQPTPTSTTTTTTTITQPPHQPTTTKPKTLNPDAIPTTYLPGDPRVPQNYGSMSSNEKWTTNPNLRAHELCSPSITNPARLIRAELPLEPEYAFRDAEIRDGLWFLMTSIEDFAKEWFPTGAHPSFTTTTSYGDTMVQKSFFDGLAPETAKVMSCVASGGPSGVWGWHDLFVDKDELQALVCGILGNVLTEQVLKHMFFGGTEEGVKAVREVQRDFQNRDGFERNKLYAETIWQHLPKPTSLPGGFNKHVKVVVGALWVHLEPLLTLVHPRPSSSSPTPTTPTLATVSKPLQRLTTTAALLSLSMALDPHTAYHHAPLFKEDNYNASTMECLNEESMKQRNMRTNASQVNSTEQARRASMSDKEKMRARGDAALTQIIAFEGVTAYRRGGWESGSSNVKKPVWEKPEYKDMGIRERVLTHGLVYCRWGWARSMQKTASLDSDTGRRVHGESWREGGFMQFVDVEGVFDWLAREREKAELRKAAVEGVVERANDDGGAADKTVLPEVAGKKGKGKKKAREEVVDDDPDR